MGVGRGDRVGIYLRKSIESVAVIFGILKAGGVYVPADPGSPATRVAYSHHNCDAKVAVVERRLEAGYREALAELGPVPEMIVLDSVGGGTNLAAALDVLDAQLPAPAVETVDPAPDDLAYILYTSGSTGTPKGVMLSHRNAVSFIDWCSETFKPAPSDIFSSHAPFHFDLSVLDIYVSLKHGATLVLIPEEAGKDPLGLAKLIEEHRISFWYSAPSTLSMLAQFGRIQDRDFSSLRIVLFAGEVFPIVHLRSFKRQVPYPSYFNLYGPTETNVCTWFEIPSEIPDDRADPYPIGKTCSNLESLVVDPDGKPVEKGTEGELCIAGPHVMQGYWGMPEKTVQSFLHDGTARLWYKTGDIVVADPDGNYRYLGRRDRMVKKRGYRIELGEIEACLYRHPAVSEAAVVAISDTESDIKVNAHLSIQGERRPSLIELKTFCSKHLPLYMVPDAFVFHEALPKTSTNKMDYQLLKSVGA
jgi:amino acid adenylation domain-containing protein